NPGLDFSSPGSITFPSNDTGENQIGLPSLTLRRSGRKSSMGAFSFRPHPPHLDPLPLNGGEEIGRATLILSPCTGERKIRGVTLTLSRKGRGGCWATGVRNRLPGSDVHRRGRRGCRYARSDTNRPCGRGC